MAKIAKNKSHDEDDDSFVPAGATGGGSNNYFKPKEEENIIRIISKPIVGWVLWEDKKATRTQIDDQPDPAEDGTKPKKFMTMVVVDRNDDDKVKIFECTQQSIIKAIKALSDNPKWGKPFAYDINIEKQGDALKTKYTVTPSPKSPLEKNVIKAANEKRCYLDALFEGNDPWDVEDVDEVTPYFFK